MVQVEAHAGDSLGQRNAELVILAQVSEHVGQSLTKARITLSSGSVVEVGGASEDRAVLCEAWPHQGPPKGAQKNKVMTDATNHRFVVAKALGRTAGTILALSDPSAAAWFQGRSWMVEALQVQGIVVLVVELDEDLRASVRRAQVRQFQ